MQNIGRSPFSSSSSLSGLSSASDRAPDSPSQASASPPAQVPQHRGSSQIPIHQRGQGIGRAGRLRQQLQSSQQQAVATHSQQPQFAQEISDSQQSSPLTNLLDLPEHAPSPVGQSIEEPPGSEQVAKRSLDEAEASSSKRHKLDPAESKAEYFAELDAWASGSHAPEENRMQAIERLKVWVNDNDTDRLLSFNGLRLTSLPMLPDSVRTLHICYNRLNTLPDDLPDSISTLLAGDNLLTNLPNRLPSSLRYLDASDNQLSVLPDNLPDSLIEFHGFGNQLTRLPENMPASLRKINVHGNRITRLPPNFPPLRTLDVSLNELTSLTETLPNTLDYLNAEENSLASVPENLITRLRPGCEVFLDNNPLTERVRQNLREALNAQGYNGPSITFSMHAGFDATPTRPLQEAVADWHDDDEMNAAIAKWSTFANEPGADAYSKFLDRLRQSVNYGGLAPVFPDRRY